MNPGCLVNKKVEDGRSMYILSIKQHVFLGLIFRKVFVCSFVVKIQCIHTRCRGR